jgi:hypothetical protein
MPTGESTPHFAELLLTAKLRGKRDSMRVRRDFSDDIQQVNSILHNPKAKKISKLSAYRDWLRKHQPCVFGRAAATNKQVFICLLDEEQILLMKHGDDDLRETIRDHQKVWKRRALHGLSSSFVIVLASPSLAHIDAGPELKETGRRLMELYVDAKVEDDQIVPRHEYVYLARETEGRREYLRFATLPNIFCAQGDKRWWHDHRTPGALMITSNALGHFMHCQSPKNPHDVKRALKQAMDTIKNAHQEPGKKKPGVPATRLVGCPLGATSPLSDDPRYNQFSAYVYEGYFHTDHLIPSVFFDGSTPKKLYSDLDFSYIHDQANPEHDELARGELTDWYSVKSEIWMRAGARAEPELVLSEEDRKLSYQWLEQRLWARCRG